VFCSDAIAVKFYVLIMIDKKTLSGEVFFSNCFPPLRIITIKLGKFSFRHAIDVMIASSSV
jgi:hypothetical protein